MRADTRLKLGIGLLVLGLVMPAGTLVVAATDWPDAVKGVVSAGLFLGFEILAVPAVALMGKENFDRIVAKAVGVLARLKPRGDVSPRRYRVGLVLFAGPLVYDWVAAYDPGLRPPDDFRLLVNLGVDLVFVASLFVLGGDFWDKLRALFVPGARAVFPPSEPASAPGSGGERGDRGVRDAQPAGDGDRGGDGVGIGDERSAGGEGVPQDAEVGRVGGGRDQ